MTDSLHDLISAYFPPGWDSGDAQEEQILRVVSKVLAAGPDASDISDRRIAAQNELAKELDISAEAVVSKLGRETWSEEYPGDEYFAEHLDPALEQIEADWQAHTEAGVTDRELFIMPVSDDWLEWFKQTVDTPYEIEGNEGLPDGITDDEACRIWGTRTGERNAQTFAQMSHGDVVSFYHDGCIFATGIIDQTVESATAGAAIWENKESQYIYTLSVYQRVQLPKAQLWRDLGYQQGFTVQGLKGVADDKADTLKTEAGSLWRYFTRYYTPASIEEILGSCKPISPPAPYYWVNQSGSEEREGGYLRAPREDKPYYDLAKLEVGDIVFNYHDGAVVASSEVTKSAQPVEEDGEEYRRVEVDVTEFPEPIEFIDFYEYLWQDDVRLDKYYPLNQAGINMQYLHNMSKAGGEYLLEVGQAPDTDHDRLQERLEAPELAISLPDGLHFHGGEEARLRQQINAALNSGRHLIFTGPPGTGKSKLAKAIASQAATTAEIDGYTFTTATAEWSTFDTIGGYVPEQSGNGLEFDPRLFLDCFRDSEGSIHNQWLIIDELNRANIDKALGPLFSVLSEDSVTLPYERDEQISIEWVEEGDTTVEERRAIATSPDRFPITPAWRLIGTMNTFDKASLYDLSFAFMRRFSFIHVGVPELRTEDGVTKRALLDPAQRPNYVQTWATDDSELMETITAWHAEVSVVWSIINQYRTIGPAIVLDIFSHITAHSGGDDSAPLTSAIINLIFPQLEALRETEQHALLDELADTHELAAADDDESPTEVTLSVDLPYLRRKARDMFGLTPERGE